jgi:hypothetical protein
MFQVFSAFLLLVVCRAYFLNLKFEAVLFSEMSVNFYQTAWRHIREDSTVSCCYSSTLKYNFNTINFRQFYHLIIIIIIVVIIISGVKLSSLGTAATAGLLYQPQMIDRDCGAIGGTNIGRGN